MQSEQINELAAALVKFQAAVRNPTRSKTVRVRSAKGNYEFTYAPLDEILDHVREPLTANGLAILQGPRAMDGRSVLETRLVHSSGQWVSSEIPLDPQSSGPQALGSAITYARRYALCAMLSLAADEDDDANGAEGNGIAKQPKRMGAKPDLPISHPDAEPPPESPLADEVRAIQERITALDKAGKDTLVRYLNKHAMNLRTGQGVTEDSLLALGVEIDKLETKS